MRRAIAPFVLAAAIFSVIALPTPGHASIDPLRVTNQPGTSLLLPFFEVGLKRGPDTQYTFGNTGTEDPDNGGVNNGPTSILTNTTIWSDLGIPVFQFFTYLTGYDQVTVDLRNVLKGHLPRTASAGQDPMDAISPKGPLSQDINFASCAGVFPPAALAKTEVSHIQAALTGRPSPLTGNCYCMSHHDNIARGYITIDTVNSCTPGFPTEANYIQNVITNQNVLWGDYKITGLNMSDTMVAVRGSISDTYLTTVGKYTFYGRGDGWSAADHRQPLPTKFAAHYIKLRRHKGTTTLLIWRDPKDTPSSFGFPCGHPPLTFPLSQENIVVFDDQEHPTKVVGAPFPFATQLVTVGTASLPVTASSGWIYLDLNHAAVAQPSSDTKAAQSWVAEIQRSGHTSFTYPTFQLDSAGSATHVPVIP
jgi:hypothetical protein